MTRRLLTLATLLLALAPRPGAALVNLDAGARTVLGVQLLQDYSDPSVYYYVPQVPRLATNDDGSFQLLFRKYVGADGASSGGLFHALVEFSLPAETVTALEKELKKAEPNARIAGPVPLMPAKEGADDEKGSFQVVSATLAKTDGNAFARSVVTSGQAPVSPGSRAAVAALLSPEGATLLWDSLQGTTSDVSVAIHAYYEAAVKGYEAKVTADVNTVYTHYSQISNQQKEFTRRQLRDVTDDLQRSQVLKIEALDRTQGLNLKAGELEGLLNTVTSKLIELMFDKTAGWAADPQREAAVEANQLLGRQERGWFDSVFGGAQDTKYFTDDQWVLKKRTDVKHNVFSMTLSKSSTVKIPVDTAGNVGGLYRALKNDPRYFAVVDMSDTAFERRSVYFRIDGDYVDALQDTFNFVTVNFRKRYAGDRPDFTKSVRFTADDVKAGRTLQEVVFPRLGETGADWTRYEYQVRWSLRDGPVLRVPAGADDWIATADPAVALAPPLEKRVVEYDADRQLLRDRGFSTGQVELAVQLAGKLKVQRRLTLRAKDADSSGRVALYHDRGTPMAYSVSWFSPTQTVKGGRALLDQDYLFVAPPAPAAPAGPAATTGPASPSGPGGTP